MVKIAIYDKLVSKINDKDTSGFVLKTQSSQENKIHDADKKISDTSRLVKKQIVM